MVATLALAGCHSQRGLRGTDAGSSPDTAFEEARPDSSEGAAGRADPGLDAGGTGGVAGSGDAADAPAGRGGSAGSGGAGGGSICGVESFDPVRAPIDLFVVLDRSASMQDTADGLPPTATSPSKWTEVTQALTEVINGAGDSFAWGMKSFPEEGAPCAAESVTTRIDVPVATGNAGAVTTAIASLTPAGNGTPTSAAIRVATDYLSSLADGRARFLVLVTDGEPSCAGSAGAPMIAGATQARTDAVNALTSAAQAGYRTFVIGVATNSAAAIATLNMMAVAGAEARRDPNPLAQRYYAASTQADLVAALRTITGAVGTCSFPLERPPPVPGDVSVTIGSADVPHDPSRTNGWEYGIGGYDTVEVYGSWCDTIRGPTAPHVGIVFACPAEDGGGDARADGGSRSGTILLSDDFEDGTSDGWLPASVGVPITWGVVADGTNHVFAQQDATLTLSRVAGGDVAWTDQAVEARVKFLTTPDQVQLAVRFLDANNYYFVELSADGRVKIRKRGAGVTTDLAALPGAAPLVIDTWYTLGLTIQGATLTAYLDGIPAVTATDNSPPAIAAGGIGLATNLNAAAFDDVKVTVP